MYYHTLVPLTALLINVYAISSLLAFPKRNNVDKAFLYFAGVSTLWSIIAFCNGFFFKNSFLIIIPILGRILGYGISFFILHFTYVLINRKKDIIYILSLSSFIMFVILTAGFENHKEFFMLVPHGTIFKPTLTMKVMAVFSFIHYCMVFIFVLKRVIKDKTPVLKNPLMLLLSGFFIRLSLVLIFGLIGYIFNFPLIDMTAFGASLEMLIFLYLGKKFRFLTIGLNEINNAVLENASVGIIALTNNNDISLINKKATLILNIDKDVHLNNINSVIKDTSLLKDGNVFELKMQKDRQIITVEIGVFDIKKNSINLGKLLILEDVSEDRKIREEVKQTEAKFKAVVENSTDPIVMFSPLNGRFIFANDALSKLSKYSKDEIYNSFSLFDLLPKDYSGKEDLKKWLSEIARGDLTENATYESLLLTKDNKIIDIIVSTAIIQFDDDVAVVSVLKDISDRKRFEEEREMLILDLGRANSELKKLVEMKNDFLAVASHDLRSPFNSIIGFSDLLLDDDSLLEKHKKFISNINTSAKIQLEYINDLLDIIKMESGEVSLTKSKIKASTLINLSCDAIAILALQKNINIDIKIEDNITLQVDTPKIVQVLNNLISNAVKFTQKGGMITIKSYLKDEKVYFHIIDTGMGLEESKLKLLFKTYKQIYTKGTEGEKGTGLGLSICKKMVEAHGGEIFAKSVLNEGSDFYFYLYK